jgi:hypothetical protein
LPGQTLGSHWYPSHDLRQYLPPRHTAWDCTNQQDKGRRKQAQPQHQSVSV